jgi:hypothetical protein
MTPAAETILELTRRWAKLWGQKHPDAPRMHALLKEMEWAFPEETAELNARYPAGEGLR